jgi:NTE family protein
MTDVAAPVEALDTGSVHDRPEAGIALCLSGGGYRAMLFHLGALWRLNDAGFLTRLDRISSVSGGSITAALLGLQWSRLAFDAAGVATRFDAEVVQPIRALADRTIDVGVILKGLLLPGSINRWLARAYRKRLYGRATLQALPERPRFVINATNLQSGALWRFMRPYLRDWRVGEIPHPVLEVAAAVAASSAFPPLLSPATFRFAASAYTPGSGADLQMEPYTTHVMLADGGVYDNLGLETAWKRYQTIFVSDAGGLMQPAPAPWRNWISQIVRVLEVVDNQVRSLRKRQVIGSFERGDRSGAYWGIRTDIAHYELPDALPCPPQRTLELARVATRLRGLDRGLQDRLVNWGYAVCDAALRKHVDPTLPAPRDFPCRGGVG